MATKEEQKADSSISDIVGALTDPIIVMPSGWGEDLSPELKKCVTPARLIENMKAGAAWE